MSRAKLAFKGRSLKALLLALAVGLPLAPIVAGLMISASGPGQAAAAFNPYQPLSRTPAAALPSVPATGKHALLPAGRGSLLARLRHPVALHATPSGKTVGRLPLRTNFGSPQVLLVERTSGSWLGVVSPQAGNNHLGWVPASAVTFQRIQWALHVSLSQRRLTVLEDGRDVQSYAVAIGRPTAPTPTGRFAVTDLLSTGDPTGPYGCCILATSARSPHAIQGWSGGDRIAIHSTPETASIGQPVSHGCVRVTLAAGRWLLAHIPLGTPVRISA